MDNKMVSSEIIYSANNSTETKNVDDIDIVNMTCLLDDQRLFPEYIQAKQDLMACVEKLTTKYGKLMEVHDLAELATALIRYNQVENEVVDNLYVGFTDKGLLIKVNDM